MGISHRRIRQYVANGAEALWRLAAIGVLLSLWTGPLPWLHRHSPTVDVNQAQILASHLTDWHDEAREISAEWHLHFATLGDIVRGRGCPAAPGSDDADVPIVGPLSIDSSADSGLVLTRTSPFSETMADQGARLATSSFERTDWSSRRQFLADFCPSRRLKIVLCVARC